MVTMPLEPYQWRKDPNCYISKAAFSPDMWFDPQPQALKWRKPRSFSGYLYTNFEGWTFVAAKRREKPDGLGEGRYQATVDYQGVDVGFAPEPRTYWVQFVGREALCNSQRPDDANFDFPNSPNLLIVDRFKTRSRVQ